MYNVFETVTSVEKLGVKFVLKSKNERRGKKPSKYQNTRNRTDWEKSFKVVWKTIENYIRAMA